jgi:hypothetical protein
LPIADCRLPICGFAVGVGGPKIDNRQLQKEH